MIKQIVIRDSFGKLKARVKNQDFSEYEKMSWKLGTDLDGKVVTYFAVSKTFSIDFSNAFNKVFASVFVFSGDIISLENDEVLLDLNTFKPFP